jgi:hypothetical protein
VLGGDHQPQLGAADDGALERAYHGIRVGVITRGVAVMSAISAVAPPLLPDSSSSRICPVLEASICTGMATTACWLARCTGSMSSRMEASKAGLASRG